MTREEVIERIKRIPNGANIGITYRSPLTRQLNAASRKAGINAEKEGRVVLAKGMRKDRDPENIPGERTWGKHSAEDSAMTNGQSFVVEHNGKYYIDFEIGSGGGKGISAPKYRYFIDGKEVSKEELEPIMQPAAYRRMNEPHREYSLNIDHITDIRYKGRAAESLHEDLDELVGGEFFDDELRTGNIDIEEAFDAYNGTWDDPMEAEDSYGLDAEVDDFDSVIYRTPDYKLGADQLERDRMRRSRTEAIEKKIAERKALTEAKNRKATSKNALRENLEAQKYGYRNAAEMKAANKF